MLLRSFGSTVGRAGLRVRRRTMLDRNQRSPVAAVISIGGFAVYDVVDVGILWAFCCVVDTLPGQCGRRRPGANPIVVAIFRIKQLVAERSSVTCQRRRSSCLVGLPGHGLEITAYAWASNGSWSGSAPGRSGRYARLSLPVTPCLGSLAGTRKTLRDGKPPSARALLGSRLVRAPGS